jgi:hypothetical protein
MKGKVDVIPWINLKFGAYAGLDLQQLPI